MKKLKTKGLDKKEYELNYGTFYEDDKVNKKHLPDINIIPFMSFGYGTRIPIKKCLYEGLIEPNDSELNGAEVVAFYNRKGKFIIEAEQNTKNEKKRNYIKQIVNEVDFKQGLANETFVSMLTNVFSKKILKEILNADDIEILSFEGLMYLKVGKKAYRL